MSYPPDSVLKKESGWWPVDGDAKKKWIIRAHYVLHEHGTPTGNLAMGDMIDSYNASDLNLRSGRSETTQFEKYDHEAAIIENVFDSELLLKLSASLGFTLPSMPPISMPSADFTARVNHTFTSRVTRENTTNESSAVTHTWKIRPKMPSVQPSSSTRYILPKIYEERVLDLYFVWVDRLGIDYTKNSLRLRKKRIKCPPFSSHNGHPANESRTLVTPFASYHYWLPKPHSIEWIPQDQYRLEVPDPSEIATYKILDPRNFYRENFRHVSSLYKLSNEAFPLKWVDRFNKEARDEVKAIELDEAKGTQWWKIFGPQFRANPEDPLEELGGT